MNLIATADGSHTIYIPEILEHYHSTFGAISESMHVYINQGLSEMLRIKNKITIFEAGFGTGLNAYLSCIESMRLNADITYYSIEKYPVDFSTACLLNYPSFFPELPDAQKLFQEIHKADWNETVRIRDHFMLHKIMGDLTEFKPGFTFDVVYFDAFAPQKQPEMWSKHVFDAIFNAMNEGGLLTTYCVKGDVKRALKQAGFTIEKLPGAPGKREMMRGWRKRKEGRGERGEERGERREERGEK
jgi:tRNA U34 5-methylaminomethyl-2-thiouridine-forming methyltransferase MnmC